MTTDERPTTAINISRFDYAREIYGVTATLSPTGQEWLALLVQLRATGGRDLLFIFNPEGVLVHEELLQRRRGRVPRVGLGAAGPAGGRQEIASIAGCPCATTSANVGEVVARVNQTVKGVHVHTPVACQLRQRGADDLAPYPDDTLVDPVRSCATRGLLFPSPRVLWIAALAVRRMQISYGAET